MNKPTADGYSLALCSVLVVFLSCAPAIADEDAGLRIGYGGMKVVGPARDQLASLETNILKHLNDGDVLQVVTSPEVRDVLAQARTGALAWGPGIASSIGAKFDLAALLYLTAVTDEKLADDGVGWLQATVVHTRPQAEIVLPIGPVSLKGDAQQVAGELATQVAGRLPPVGRVVAVIQTGQQIHLQVYMERGPGIAARTGSEYSLYTPLQPADTVITTHLPQAEDQQSLQARIPSRRLDSVRLAEVGADGLASVALTDVLQVPPLGTLVTVASQGDNPYCNGEDATIVMSDPAGAACRSGDVCLGLTPLLVKAAQASANDISLCQDGFKTCVTPIASSDKPRHKLTFVQAKLEEIPPFGTLTVSSQPTGATVTVDGKKVGETPLRMSNFRAGEHRVQIALADYEGFEGLALVKPQEQTEVDALLVRAAQKVTITTEPPGATVLVDGKKAAKTPVQDLSLAIGGHRLVLELDGFAGVEHDLQVTAETAPDPVHIVLQPLPGSLTLTSEPAGVDVWIDGNAAGRTPLMVAALAAGQHQGELRKEGYASKCFDFAIKATEKTECAITLERQNGSLTITTVPAGAEVRIDGTLAGTTPLDNCRVSTGTHKLLLSLAAYHDWEHNVEVLTGEVTKVAVGLISAAEHLPPAPPEQHAAGGQAVTLPLTMDDFVEVQTIQLTDTLSGRSTSLRILVAGKATDPVCRCVLELPNGFPQATRVIVTHRMAAVVIPQSLYAGAVQKHEINKGPLTDIQIGQLSRRDETVRVELDILRDAKITHGFPDRRHLLVEIALPTQAFRKLSDRRIALTFDDFPFADSDVLLECLDDLGVRATLFTIGNKVESYSQLVRRAAMAGHRVESHTFDHRPFRTLTDKEVTQEIRLANEAIMRVTHERPQFLRAPGGNCDGNHHQIVRAEGLAYCGWTINPGDYKTQDAAQIAAQILAKAQPNAIVLLHDGVPATIEALRQVVPILRQRGYSFVPVQELLNPGAVVQR